MASINELIGGLKTPTDLRSTPYRLPYTLAPSVGPDLVNTQTIRLTFPKVGYLDASSLKFRGLLETTSPGADASRRLDLHTVDGLIQRCRVVHGSTVIYDAEQNNIMVNTLAQFETTETNYQSMDRFQNDYPQDAGRTSQVTTASNSTEILGRLGPWHSFVSGNHLIPLKTLTSPLHIDITFTPSNEAFLSTDVNISYQITDFELVYRSIESSSLDQFYATNTHSLHTTIYSHLYNVIPVSTTQVNLNLPSNHSHINGILSLFRDQADVSDVTTPKNESAGYAFTNFSEVDFRVNTKSIYDDVLTHLSTHYDQLEHVFPEVVNSKAITPAGYSTGTQFMLCNSLMNAPSQFSDKMLSGLSSTRLSTDLLLQVKFAAPTAVQLQVDSWVKAQVQYRFSRGKIEVML